MTQQKRMLGISESLTFKQFMSEAAYNKDLTPQFVKIEGEVREYLEQHCSDAMWMFDKPNSTRIYRGQANNQVERLGYAFVDPSKTERTSQNTSNHYTEIFDNIEAMKSFPKRSRSFISSTSYARALEYSATWDGLRTLKSELVVLVPFNGVKIGSVEDVDMWDITISFFGKQFNIEQLNGRFEAVVEDTWEDIERYATRLKSLSNDDPLVKEFYKMFEAKIPNAHEKLMEEIQKAYSPSRTGFKVYTTATLPKSNFHNKEVWVGGPCVAISEEMMRELIKQQPDENY